MKINKFNYSLKPNKSNKTLLCVCIVLFIIIIPVLVYIINNTNNYKLIKLLIQEDNFLLDNFIDSNNKLTLYQTFRVEIPNHIIKNNLECLPKNINYNFNNDKDIDNFFKTRLKKEINLFKNLKHPAHKMDLWRYLIIYENGGIYLDADGFFENCLDISMYNKYDHIFIFDPGYKNIHNGFFYSKNAKYNVYKKVIERMIKTGSKPPDWWYNLRFLREELEKVCNINLEKLKKPYDTCIDKQNNKILFLTSRTNDYVLGLKGEKFYQFKHKDYPYDKK